MPTTPEQAVAWSDIIDKAGVVVFLVVVVVAFVREWVVTGSLHRRLLSESSERERQWRELALRGSGIAAGALDVARGRAGDGDGTR